MTGAGFEYKSIEMECLQPKRTIVPGALGFPDKKRLNLVGVLKGVCIFTLLGVHVY